MTDLAPPQLRRFQAYAGGKIHYTPTTKPKVKIEPLSMASVMKDWRMLLDVYRRQMMPIFLRVPEPDRRDLIQEHRLMVVSILSMGEQILYYSEHPDVQSKGGQSYVKFLESNLAAMREDFVFWHTSKDVEQIRNDIRTLEDESSRAV